MQCVRVRAGSAQKSVQYHQCEKKKESNEHQACRKESARMINSLSQATPNTKQVWQC